MFVGITIFLSSCATGKLYINGSNLASSKEVAETPLYSLYAIGDAGEQNEQATAVLDALTKETAKATAPGMVIFLGDNIYPAGLAVPSETEKRKYGEDVLKRQVEALKNYKGEIIFIPGNHDWNEFSAGGLEAIKREGEFLQGFGLPNLHLFPEDGCGGPYVKELTPHAVLLIVDSQWWIQDWDKESKMNEGCVIKSREAMITRLHALLQQYHDRQILIAMHHPVESRGPHGGYFSFRDHVFPLSKLVDWLYIPLPVIGSIYPWTRQIVGISQDENGVAYKALEESLMTESADHHIIFLAGHEHNLEYLQHQGHDVLISGAGSKQNPVADGKELRYGHKAAGFMKLDFYPKGGIEMSAFEVDVKGKSAELVYKARLREGKP